MDSLEPFRDVLEVAFNFSFDPALAQDKKFKNLEPDASPLTFYDRHINPKLLCRDLKDFASLGPTLSKVFDEAIAKFYDHGYKFSATTCRITSTSDATPLKDARSLNALYCRKPGGFAHHFPSKFYFHPDGVVWDSVFYHCKDILTEEKRFTSECSLQVDYRHDKGYKKFNDLRPFITDSTGRKLENMRNSCPPLANWLFFPMTSAGKSILKQMQGSRSLRWETSRTVGFKNISSVTLPLDADNGVLHRARILSRRRIKITKSSQRKAKDKVVLMHEASEIFTPLTQKKSGFINVSRKPVRSVRRYLDPHQYIQHAWATAARQDSTFMVFNCGMYERIGIRHRESQTLYISPLIETINTRNPPYGKLHLGLHTAIVEDFLERYERDNQESGKKRSADHFDDEDFSQKKRVKVSLPALGDDGIEQLWGEMNKRELALVTLNYNPYSSPVPASFFRSGSSCARGLYQPFTPTKKSKFSQIEYFELILGEPLGQGAVGIVHPAALSLSLESGETLRHNLVVKLAFSKEQKAKLLSEYTTYTLLAKAKEPVEGIVTVHGLFKDPDSDVLALFMENGGQSLRTLDKEQPERDEQLRDQECESCIRALESIHKAGIRHRDLRPDNILISRDASLKVSIVDFDCAVYGPHPEKFENEINRVKAIFDGEDVDWWHS